MNINRKYINRFSHNHTFRDIGDIATEFFIEGNNHSLLCLLKDIRKTQKTAIHHKKETYKEFPLYGIRFTSCKKMKNHLRIKIDGCSYYLEKYINQKYPELLVYFIEYDDFDYSISCCFPKEKFTNYRYFIQEDRMAEHCHYFNSLKDLKYNYCRKFKGYNSDSLNTLEDINSFLSEKIFFLFSTRIVKP